MQQCMQIEIRFSPSTHPDFAGCEILPYVVESGMLAPSVLIEGARIISAEVKHKEMHLLLEIDDKVWRQYVQREVFLGAEM